MTKAFKSLWRMFLFRECLAQDGVPTFCFEEQSGEDDGLRIMVNSQGMWTTGTLHRKITNQAELQDFAKLISVAWTEHEKLAPKLTRTLSGH